MTDAEVAELRRIAENPLVRPSERVAARRKLAEMGVTLHRSRRDEQAALLAAREMLLEMGFD